MEKIVWAIMLMYSFFIFGKFTTNFSNEVIHFIPTVIVLTRIGLSIHELWTKSDNLIRKVLRHSMVL